MSEKIRGIGYMTIGGKTRPFQVNGIRQASAFCEVMGVELDEYWPKMGEVVTNTGALSDRRNTIAFIYSVLFAGAKKEREVIDFDHEDVTDWFEEADETDAAEFMKPLQLWSVIMNKAIQTFKEAEESKKA